MFTYSLSLKLKGLVTFQILSNSKYLHKFFQKINLQPKWKKKCSGFFWLGSKDKCLRHHFQYLAQFIAPRGGSGAIQIFIIHDYGTSFAVVSTAVTRGLVHIFQMVIQLFIWIRGHIYSVLSCVSFKFSCQSWILKMNNALTSNLFVFGNQFLRQLTCWERHTDASVWLNWQYTIGISISQRTWKKHFYERQRWLPTNINHGNKY